MDVIEAINSRRAVKNFDPNHKMTEKEEENLLSLAMMSPTAFNIQNWRFVVVKDESLLKEIQEAAWGQAQITDSSLLVVLCANLNSWNEDPQRYWKNASKDVQDFLLPAIDNYYRDKESVQRDEALRSCGMAAQTIMLAAKEMGYDTCPMDGFDFEKVSELINLPENHIVTMFVTVGKKIQDAWPRGGQLEYQEVVISNKFS